MDYTLKFASEAEANAVLYAEQTQVMAELVETIKASNFPSHSIDIIGTIYKPTGKLLTNANGSFPETAPAPGWHVNVRGPAHATLAQHHINVETPVRVWA